MVLRVIDGVVALLVVVKDAALIAAGEGVAVAGTSAVVGAVKPTGAPRPVLGS
jgi:hypothetical protein